MPIDTNSQQYAEWNQQGLIPGPDESEHDFIQRIQFCLNLEDHLFQTHGIELPFKKSDSASDLVLKEAYPLTQELFGTKPNWVPIFFSNHQLSSWQGGCAWIFQLTQDTPTAAFLQLRTKFHDQPSYLGLYKRDELLAHEISHVGRMMYQEPQFEEVLAYRTSSKKWRSWLGPIVQSPKESLFFVLLIGFVILGDAALFGLGQSDSFGWNLVLILIPLFIALLGFCRLGWRQWQFSQCLKKLKNLYGSQQLANEIIYRLTDKEIKLFAKQSEDDTRRYIQNQKSFRWVFLNQIYAVKSN